MDTPLSPTFLAELRHDLANPVNHVVGYAELLVMSANERQATELQTPLQEITRCASDLRRHLEEELPLTRIRTLDVDLPKIRSSVIASATELLEQIVLLKPRIAGRWAEAEDDLTQIEQAARRLLELAARPHPA